MPKYPKSIMTDDMTKCYMCGSSNWIEIHHVIGGAYRAKSTKYGLVVPLCHYCHTEPPEGVHHNAANMAKLRAEAQAKFEELHGHAKWMAEFHKNYK